MVHPHVAEALRAAALHAEQHKATRAPSGPEAPSDEDRARTIAEASALGHELDGLAAASETAQVYPREVEAVRRELQAGSPGGRLGAFNCSRPTIGLVRKRMIEAAAARG